MIFYNPGSDYSSIDMWAIHDKELWYVYHLQSTHPDSQHVQPVNYGYCTSTDLMDFTYRGEFFKNDEPWEKTIPYAGDVIKWRGKYFMLYSATNHTHIDGVGLLISDDLIHWEKYEHNPVMQFPDARWYEGTSSDTITGMINLRDLHFINDVCTDECVYICFSAATGAADGYRSGCIGLARSTNMIDWEYLPPLFSPNLYTLMEVPRVFSCDGKYFLTWLTAPWYGFRTDSDMDCRAKHPGETQLHYAIADHPLGPYYLPENPCMFQGFYSPYVIDPVVLNGRPHLLSTMFRYYDNPEDPRIHGGLLPALPLAYRNKLVCTFPYALMKYYPERVEMLEQPLQIPYNQCHTREGRLLFTDTAICVVPLTAPLTRAVTDIKLSLQKGRAGVFIRYNADNRVGYAILYDHDRNEIEFAKILPLFRQAVKLWSLERHCADAMDPDNVNLKVIAEADHILVFIDDILMATYSFPCKTAGSFGIILESTSGNVELSDWYTT